MSTSSREDRSSDEFESADEGEPTSLYVAKPSTPPLTSPSDPTLPSMNENQVQSICQSQAVTDGWNDWNIDDEQPMETAIETSSKSLKYSVSSRPKTGNNLSQAASGDDERSQSSDQQRLQRKKYRKKQTESNLHKEEKILNTQTSHITERSNEKASAAVTTTVNKHDIQDTHYILDQLAAQSPKQAPIWHNPWNNFGSLLSTAKQSVSMLTSTVSDSFSAVIESVEAGLGAPDPQKLAEMNQMAFKIKGETSDSEDEPEVPICHGEKNDPNANQDGWLNALSLEKLTDTGMKVVSGSLDVLETVGKKTFDVINEADPELKGTRRLLSKRQQPTLSEIIREAKNEKETSSMITTNDITTFLQLFEKHQGLAHFEALELLSNQSSVVLQTMSHGNEKILEQIDSYFQLNDDDLEINDVLNSLTVNDDNDNNQIPTLDSLSQKFIAYQTQLHSTVSVEKLLEVYESANRFLKEWDWMDTEMDQKTLADEAIDCLAILCARIIEYYRRTAELFLLGCKSLTSFSIDIELLTIYEKQQKNFSGMLEGIPNLFAKHMKQISNMPPNGTDMPIRYDIKLKQKLLNQMFIQLSSSQTYASDAYVLLKPIVSQSILFHTSTTR